MMILTNSYQKLEKDEKEFNMILTSGQILNKSSMAYRS